MMIAKWNARVFHRFPCPFSFLNLPNTRVIAVPLLFVSGGTRLEGAAACRLPSGFGVIALALADV